MRLYLATALVFFFAWPLTPFPQALDAYVTGYVTGFSETSRSLDSLQVVFNVRPVPAAARAITDSLPALFLAMLVPALGLLLFVVNRGSGRVVGNLVAALHLHAVIFLFFIAIVPFEWLFRGSPAWENVIVPILLLGLLTHLATSVARVNEISFMRATGRLLSVLFLYFALATFALAAAMGPPPPAR